MDRDTRELLVAIALTVRAVACAIEPEVADADDARAITAAIQRLNAMLPQADYDEFVKR